MQIKGVLRHHTHIPVWCLALGHRWLAPSHNLRRQMSMSQIQSWRTAELFVELLMGATVSLQDVPIIGMTPKFIRAQNGSYVVRCETKDVYWRLMQYPFNGHPLHRHKNQVTQRTFSIENWHRRSMWFIRFQGPGSNRSHSELPNDCSANIKKLSGVCSRSFTTQVRSNWMTNLVR